MDDKNWENTFLEELTSILSFTFSCNQLFKESILPSLISVDRLYLQVVIVDVGVCGKTISTRASDVWEWLNACM